MKIIKKFVPVKLEEKCVNDTIKADLVYGGINFSYGRRIMPREEFDTEAEAIEHAYNTNRWAEWIILPTIRFDNF